MKFLKKLYFSDQGATAVEYGLIVALIALAAFAAIAALADVTVGLWDHIAGEVVKSS